MQSGGLTTLEQSVESLQESTVLLTRATARLKQWVEEHPNDEVTNGPLIAVSQWVVLNAIQMIHQAIGGMLGYLNSRLEA